MTTTTAAVPQHMLALNRANRIRLARANLKRQITRGEMSVVEILDPQREIPTGMERMGIFDLLRTQWRWGRQRARRFLSVLPERISENRALADLTPRQRRMIVEALKRMHPEALTAPGQSV